MGLLREENSYLKSKLAVEETVHESLLTRVQQPSLCVICHSSEAIYPLPSQQRECEREALLRKLTAEREECMRLLTALRDTLQCVREREREAVTQVKQSVDTSTAAIEEKDRVLVHVIELERDIENLNKRQESLLSSVREQHEVELEGMRRESLHKYRELEARLTEANSDVKLRDGEISSLSQSKQLLERKLKSAQSEMFEAESKSMHTVHELRSRAGVLEAEKQNLSGVVESVRLEQEVSESRGAQELSRARQELEQQRAYLLASREESAKLREHSLEAETDRNKYKNQVRTLKYEIDTLRGNTRSQLMQLEEAHNLKCRKLIEEMHKLRDSNEVLKAALDETRERETHVVSGGQNELKKVQEKLERQTLSLNKELEVTKDSLTHLEFVHKQCNEDNSEFIRRSVEERREIERQSKELQVLKEKRKEDTVKIKNLMTRQNNLLRERLQLCEMLEQVYQKPEKDTI